MCLNRFFGLCPGQSGGAGGTEYAAVLQAVCSGESGPYTGDVALVFSHRQVNTVFQSLGASS